MREDITFPSYGVTCRGWFYPAESAGPDAAPDTAPGTPGPCVVMAHGLAAVKEMRLDAYAERFAAAGLNVLVVDDNATNREIVHAYLRSSGVRCELADSGAAALAAMHAAVRAGEPFDIVVLDAQMPEMDGLDLAAAISQAPSLRPTRLVMLTSTGEHRARARELGITGYLTKPVRTQELDDALARVTPGPPA